MSDAESKTTTLPWPGDELAYRVAGVTDRDWFYESGERSARDIENVLALTGRSFDSFSSILDFGCGCGRILLWLEKISAMAQLHGVDIDERAIRWVQNNLPYVDAKVNQPLPPLDYADATFDLVYNHSVFTHIDEDYQDQWLAELRRVTKPGGIVLLSVHGEHAFHEYETASSNAGGDPNVAREELSRRGIVHMRDDAWVGSAFPDFYHTTFHAPWYVFKHWSRIFKILAYVPRGSLDHQDFVLLERPADGVQLPEAIDPVHGSAPTTDVASNGPVNGAGSRASAAIDAVEALAYAPPDVNSAAGYGSASTAVRKVMQRLLRHYDEHQKRVHGAIVGALRQLEAQPTEAVGGLTLSEAHARLWDALRREGERVNRLEADLWRALKTSEPATGEDGRSTTKS